MTAAGSRTTLEQRARRTAARTGAPLLPPGRPRRRHRGRGRRRLGHASGSCRTCSATSPRSTWHTPASAPSCAPPLGVAPTTLQRAAHPDGEVAMAARPPPRPAPLMVALQQRRARPSRTSRATGVDWWPQLYVTADRPTCVPLLERAVAAGAKAVVLTADTPVVGTKYDDGPTVWDVRRPRLAAGELPAGVRRRGPATTRPPTSGRTTSTGWRRVTGLPVVVKGVLRPDDARRCVDAGAAAVWVSNHGGRQLDYAAATADVPRRRRRRGRAPTPRCTSTGECAPAGTRWPRSPSGPARCSSGRPPLYALAVDGADGRAPAPRRADRGARGDAAAGGLRRRRRRAAGTCAPRGVSRSRPRRE